MCHVKRVKGVEDMASTQRPLSKREEQFCWQYAATQNAREAAIRAGYGALFAEQTAARLMKNEAVKVRLTALSSEQEQRAKSVRVGLERLAFGPIADAVTLLCAEDAASVDIQSLDLFSVAEIKRPKGGGFEIKFFDRLKALERLALMDEKTGSEGAAPFYRAIEQGVLALNGQDEGDE